MNKKPIYQSKTFWAQIVAVVSTTVPAVGDFIRENPEGFVAVLGALNVLVRFATKGGVTLLND